MTLCVWYMCVMYVYTYVQVYVLEEDAGRCPVLSLSALCLWERVCLSFISCLCDEYPDQTAQEKALFGSQFRYRHHCREAKLQPQRIHSQEQRVSIRMALSPFSALTQPSIPNILISFCCCDKNTLSETWVFIWLTLLGYCLIRSITSAP